MIPRDSHPCGILSPTNVGGIHECGVTHHDELCQMTAAVFNKGSSPVGPGLILSNHKKQRVFSG